MYSMPIRIALIYNKSNTFGLKKDILVLRTILQGQKYLLTEYDPLEPPVASDVAIHVETPIYVWSSYANTNILIVNPEWYSSHEWDPYLKFFHIFCKDMYTLKQFQDKGARTSYCGWEMMPHSKQLSPNAKDEYVWFCGGSKHKRSMIPYVLQAWKSSYPPLHIYTTAPIEESVPEFIHVYVKNLDSKTHEAIATTYKGHLVLSEAEAFGYTAAEAIQYGATCLFAPIPAFLERYSQEPGVHFLDLPTIHVDCASRIQMTIETLSAAFEKVICTPTYIQRSYNKWDSFVSNFRATLKAQIVSNERPTMPPVLVPNQCPRISVVTLVHNRPLFVQNACLNLMLTDYPKDKIEWVVVDDSDPDQSGSDKIIQFQNTFEGTVTYVPLVKKTAIGKKRNLGIQRAKNDILLMMDDDDHVPITAFRRRVAWLLKGRTQYECAVCTVLPMYDLRRGLSAVNVPPVTLGLAKRCSEATLTFTRAFWQARPFPETNLAEGEGFLAGREEEVVEMPPQHVIVAFQHGTNSSGRSLPDSAGKGCFWGFDKVYLRFIHGLVGVQIEEENA